MPCGSPSNAGRPSNGLWFKLWPDGYWEASPMTFLGDFQGDFASVCLSCSDCTIGLLTGEAGVSVCGNGMSLSGCEMVSLTSGNGAFDEL